MMCRWCFLLDLPGCLETGRETSVRGRMQTSGPFWEEGEARAERSAWYSSPSVFSNSWCKNTCWNQSSTRSHPTTEIVGDNGSTVRAFKCTEARPQSYIHKSCTLWGVLCGLRQRRCRGNTLMHVFKLYTQSLSLFRSSSHSRILTKAPIMKKLKSQHQEIVFTYCQYCKLKQHDFTFTVIVYVCGITE